MSMKHMKPWHLIVVVAAVVVVVLIAIPLASQFLGKHSTGNSKAKATATAQASTEGGTNVTLPGQTATTGPTAAPPAAVLNIEHSMLDNIANYGYNNSGNVNNGLGGLWVNWKYGSASIEAKNLNGSGVPDTSNSSSLRHDPETDLRYLHALWLYQSRNPNDTQYKSQIDKFTTIIKTEFNQSRDERGWLFDEEFMDLYRLSGDSFYKDTAMSLARSYAKNFDPKVGTIYKKNSGHPLGSYRVDLSLEAGCALIQAGTLFQNPTWVQEGQSTVNFIYDHAYIAQYHTFPAQVDEVHLPGGGVNPSEVFFSDSQNQDYTVAGNIMEMGALAQISFSLLNTYQVTHQQDYLNKATDLLDQLTSTSNTLGLWDNTNKGYFLGITFTGSGPKDPGTLQLKSQNKEAGRQMTILQVFHLANSLTNNRYQLMEQQMRDVAINKAYYAPGHGVLYEVQPDWTPVLAHGVQQDWVTSEATGAELEALSTI